jgi:hypothetical protein
VYKARLLRASIHFLSAKSPDDDNDGDDNDGNNDDGDNDDDDDDDDNDDGSFNTLFKCQKS